DRVVDVSKAGAQHQHERMGGASHARIVDTGINRVAVSRSLRTLTIADMHRALCAHRSSSASFSSLVRQLPLETTAAREAACPPEVAPPRAVAAAAPAEAAEAGEAAAAPARAAAA